MTQDVSSTLNGIKVGLQLMANLRTAADLKNCELEKPSLLLGPLAEYPGVEKRRVLSPCVAYIF